MWRGLPRLLGNYYLFRASMDGAVLKGTGMSASDAETTSIAVTVPSDQREGNQASVHRWLKAVGDSVKKNEPLLEINTDKVTLEVVAPVSGTLVEICKQPKQPCELHEVFGRIVPSDATQPRASAIGSIKHDSDIGSRSSPPTDTARLSPAVRALSAATGIDAAHIAGSGAGGRVTARDIERSASGSAQAGVSSGVRARAAGSEADVLVPHTPMRRTIAAEMARSVSVAPHVTSVFECDFDAVLAHRAAHKEQFAQRGVKLTVTSYLLRAAAQALKAVPEVNASWHDEHIALHPQINIGIATALEQAQGGGAGLVVPVVRQVDSLDLFNIAQTLQRFTELSRSGKLSAAELSGGTFTISNHGVSGSLVASPIIILQPQVAILGVGKVERRMVVTEINGREVMEVRSRAYVTLTIDHRALDGFTANRFLSIFVESLQRPMA